MPDAPNLDAILDSAFAAPETTPPADPAPAAPPAAPAVAETPAAPPAEPDSFPRSYVEELRRESAGYRQRAKPYDDVFGTLDDDSRSYLLELNQALVAGDTDRARALWDGIFAEPGTPAAPQAPAAPVLDQSAGYLTAADLTRILDERERRAAEQAAVKSIEDEAGSLGYSTDSADYVQLLWTANNVTNGDIAAAHAHLQAERQKIIDAYIASRQQAADSSAVAAPQTGAAPSTEQPIRTLEDAKAALMASGVLDNLR